MIHQLLVQETIYFMAGPRTNFGSRHQQEPDRLVLIWAFATRGQRVLVPWMWRQAEQNEVHGADPIRGLDAPLRGRVLKRFPLLPTVDFRQLDASPPRARKAQKNRSDRNWIPPSRVGSHAESERPRSAIPSRSIFVRFIIVNTVVPVGWSQQRSLRGWKQQWMWTSLCYGLVLCSVNKSVGSKFLYFYLVDK